MEHREGGSRSKEALDARIGRRAGRQYGVFSRKQALAVGFTRRQIERRLGAGRWEIVLPSVYRLSGASAGDRQQAMAACLWAGSDALVSHRAAGSLWGLDGVVARGPEITVPIQRKFRSRHVVVRRSNAMPRIDRAKLEAIPITTPARTIVDLSSQLEGEAVEAAFHSGLRRGLFSAALVARRLDAVAGKGRPGTRILREILQRHESGAALESRLEVKVWRLLIRSGLPRPIRQYQVALAGRQFRIDFAWPARRVAVEAEGRSAHGPERFYSDRFRLADLVSVGWRVIPVTWVDVEEAPNDWLVKVLQTLALAA